MSAVASPAARVKLRPMRVLRDALGVYRAHYLALWVCAIAVFAPLAVADALLESLDGHGTLALVLESAGETVLHLVGDVFYAGIVAAAVIAWRSGGPRQTPLQVARTLPWGTIVALDLLIPLATVALSFLLIVPGIVFYTYFSLSAPVAKVDHVGTREAMRRSARLVRGSFWRVLAILFLVVVVAGAVEQALQSLTSRLAGDVLVNIVVQTVFSPLFGLAAVLMVFDLRRSVAAAH